MTDWNIKELTGYEPKTTFYTDFSIADPFGEDAVQDTYNRAFAEWKTDIEYLTELVMVLNWKSWEHDEKANICDSTCDPRAEHHSKLSRLYVKLYQEADKWCLDNLKGDDLSYYIRTTD